jgi:hypothetical protein
VAGLSLSLSIDDDIGVIKHGDTYVPLWLIGNKTGNKGSLLWAALLGPLSIGKTLALCRLLLHILSSTTFSICSSGTVLPLHSNEYRLHRSCILVMEQYCYFGIADKRCR